MADIWFIADLHLGHKRLVDGFDADQEAGRRGPRGQFATVDHHDEMIINLWNQVVKPVDKVYVLGDVALSKSGLDKVSQLQGHKRIILGNHDQDKPKRYAELFEKVCGAKVLDGMVLTHVPVHQSALTRKSMQVNLHGHMHEEVVKSHYASAYIGNGIEPDPRYQCVSCEQVNFQPKHYDQVIADFGSYLS
jgi:calcineurin-like phosphoesterase family protein